VVRRNQVPDLLPVLAANDSPNIVFMGNNLAGPGEMIRALGKQRVMMGFVFGGGKGDGDIIRAIGPIKLPGLAVPFGEVDGTVTPRLKKLVSVLNRAGLKSQVSTDIVDWLATHASRVAVIGPMVMKYHNDIKALAKSADDLKLTTTAMRETSSVLKALGHKIVPASQSLIAILPQFMMEFMLRLLFNSKLGEVGAAWYVSQAPDEMQALADDLREMVIKSGLPVPAVRKVLYMK
jgi:2-dehydropantoate 2-reductase